MEGTPKVDFNLPQCRERVSDVPQLKSEGRLQKRKGSSYSFSRIPKLLMLGYASEESRRKYEHGRDWARMYTILMSKIDNIGIVSGLLLASSCNLLIAGDLRRMTYTTIVASVLASILSIIFGLLCKINLTPARLRFLVRRPRLFYFLYATPSLWGGGAALAFFVAICAYTWLEESTAQYGWEAKASAVILSCALIGNAVVCFILGASDPKGSGSGDQEEGNAISEEKSEDTADERENGPNIYRRDNHSENDMFGIGTEDWNPDLSSSIDSSSPESNGVYAPLRRGAQRSATFDSRADVIGSPRRASVREPTRRNTAW
ncbi:hypothetical protein M0805_007529 [Coniferiporia weirii]|nr:hypothetical protein M0805_007529 [Coniferiporia weirii]